MDKHNNYSPNQELSLLPPTQLGTRTPSCALAKRKGPLNPSGDTGVPISVLRSSPKQPHPHPCSEDTLTRTISFRNLLLLLENFLEGSNLGYMGAWMGAATTVAYP